MTKINGISFKSKEQLDSLDKEKLLKYRDLLRNAVFDYAVANKIVGFKMNW